jgi:hypothetical protein
MNGAVHPAFENVDPLHASKAERERIRKTQDALEVVVRVLGQGSEAARFGLASSLVGALINHLASYPPEAANEFCREIAVMMPEHIAAAREARAALRVEGA